MAGSVGDRTLGSGSLLFFATRLPFPSLSLLGKQKKRLWRPGRTRDPGEVDSVTQESVHKACYGGKVTLELFEKCCPHWKAGRKGKWRQITYVSQPGAGGGRVSFLNSPVEGAVPGSWGSARESAVSQMMSLVSGLNPGLSECKTL